MGALECYKQLTALYSDGKMSHEEKTQLLNGIFREFETRSSGCYENRTISTLELFDEVTKLIRGVRAEDFWRRDFMPKMRKLDWHFGSVNHFLEFHLEFAKTLISPGVIYLECMPSVNDCDVCEMMSFVDQHIPRNKDRRETKYIKTRICEGPGKMLSIKFDGVEFRIKANSDCHRVGVKWLQIEGYLQELSWNVWGDRQGSSEASQCAEHTAEM